MSFRITLMRMGPKLLIVALATLTAIIALTPRPVEEALIMSGMSGPWPVGTQAIHEYREHREPVAIVQIGQVQYSPVLSHDRRRILFVAVGDDNFADVFVYHRESGETSQLTYTAESEFHLRWSPTDQYVAYVTGVDGTFRLHIAELGGNARSIVLPTDVRPAGIAWLPTDQDVILLALAMRPTTNTHLIYALNLVDQEFNLISDRRGYYIAPSISPDGTHVAYLDLDTGSIKVQHLRDLTSFSPADGLVLGFSASWSPDSRKIAFSTITTDQDADVTVLDIYSGESYTIGRPGIDDFTPIWSPDGSRIVTISSVEATSIACVFELPTPTDCEPVNLWIETASGNTALEPQLDW